MYVHTLLYILMLCCMNACLCFFFSRDQISIVKQGTPPPRWLKLNMELQIWNCQFLVLFIVFWQLRQRNPTLISSNCLLTSITVRLSCAEEAVMMMSASDKSLSCSIDVEVTERLPRQPDSTHCEFYRTWRHFWFPAGRAAHFDAISQMKTAFLTDFTSAEELQM